MSPQLLEKVIKRGYPKSWRRRIKLIDLCPQESWFSPLVLFSVVSGFFNAGHRLFRYKIADFFPPVQLGKGRYQIMSRTVENPKFLACFDWLVEFSAMFCRSKVKDFSPGGFEPMTFRIVDRHIAIWATREHVYHRFCNVRRCGLSLVRLGKDFYIIEVLGLGMYPHTMPEFMVKDTLEHLKQNFRSSFRSDITSVIHMISDLPAGFRIWSKFYCCLLFTFYLYFYFLLFS